VGSHSFYLYLVERGENSMKCMKLIAAAAAICIPAIAVMADSVSYTTPIGATTALTPELEQFNPSLGTLTGVSVSLNVAITPIVLVINIGSSSLPFANAWTGTNPADAPTPQSGPDAPFTVADPYGNTISKDYSWEYGSGIANPGLNSFTDPNPISLSALVSSVPSGDFGNYIGLGQYLLSYTTTSDLTSQFSASLPLLVSSNYSLAGAATVTYTYSPAVNSAPVPLPASAASGLVLMGLMAIRKRRIG
jgi:hypothetical protein